MSDNFLKDTELRRVEWTRGGWQESSGVTQLRDAGVGNGAGMAVAQEGLPRGKAQSMLRARSAQPLSLTWAQSELWRP